MAFHTSRRRNPKVLPPNFGHLFQFSSQINSVNTTDIMKVKKVLIYAFYCIRLHQNKYDTALKTVSWIFDGKRPLASPRHNSPG